MQLNPNAKSILLAALALPGVVNAETPPERGEVSIKYLRYKDSQPDLDRVTVNSPSVSVIAPFAGDWALSGSLVQDGVSGATPRYHTAVSGASRMDDLRRAGDLKVTRYFERGSVAVGTSVSNENDYRSRAWSLQGSLESEDKNTTFAFGLGGSSDHIDPVNLRVKNEAKRTREYMVGITLVISKDDIAQFNFTRSLGQGYYSDPYKQLDERPRGRNADVFTLRWNHHVESSDGIARLSYRWYKDSWDIRAHTLSAEYAQPLTGGWTLTPSLRWYRQSAAYFYFGPDYDPLFGAPFPVGYKFGSKNPTSPDQRLSAFDADTLGLRVDKELGVDWAADVKLERYRQHGAAGLQPLTANFFQLGLTKRF